MAQYLEGTKQQRSRACSPAVVTEGGRAHVTDISGSFEAQTHRVFALMDETLRRAGGTLANLVTMTVFLRRSVERGVGECTRFAALAAIRVERHAPHFIVAKVAPCQQSAAPMDRTISS
jgi:enamine deaminase RidA (YjgF/YER057c/UK114 family)